MNTNCEEWTGTIEKDGYGVLSWQGRQWRAHRWAWVQEYGMITSNQWVLHKCDNRLCIRLDHLYLGGPVENGRDMQIRNRSPKKNLKCCVRGHLFNEENTRIRRNGTRCCRKCDQIRAAKCAS